MLKFCIAIICLIINIVNACKNECEYDKNNMNQICYIKAQDCLLLKCTAMDDIPLWVRQSNGTNTTITVGQQLTDIYFSKSSKQLNITYVRSIDSGLNSFLAFRLLDEQLICKFNVFVYDSNWNGSLTVHDQTKVINSTEAFNIELKTFTKRVNFTYQYEAMPLDYLTVNNTKIIETESCEATLSWLNCLIARDVDLNLKRCTQNFDLYLGYNFENDYSSIQDEIKIKNYTHNIVFRCK